MHASNLNDTHLNSYSVPSDPLEIGSDLTIDYTLYKKDLIRTSARE